MTEVVSGDSWSYVTCKAQPTLSRHWRLQLQLKPKTSQKYKWLSSLIHSVVVVVAAAATSVVLVVVVVVRVVVVYYPYCM